MLINGIINPHLLNLIARVRHTNSIVIADNAFPSWPGLETVDLSLVKGVPTIIQVLDAILPNWVCGQIHMAEEFRVHNTPKHQSQFKRAFRGAPVSYEPHVNFKQRVPHAIGLIRTGDTTMYGNLILVSA